MTAILLVVSLIVFVALGVPIAFSIILSAMTGILIGGVCDMSVVPIQMYDGVNSFTLMAIPMFALMGEIMGQTSLGTKLINIANEAVGWIKGGLGMATVVVCMLFGTISGSAVAAAAALTGILIPEMEKRNYPRGLACSIMSSASTLAVIIPPSSALIIYGVAAGVSINDLCTSRRSSPESSAACCSWRWPTCSRANSACRWSRSFPSSASAWPSSTAGGPCSSPW